MPPRNRSSHQRPEGGDASGLGNLAGYNLVLIDQGRLHGAAWAEFHTVRKRLDKATRDLHRHEEVDTPAYDHWLHLTFPVQVTTLRELHAEVAVKARKVHAVRLRAATSGGSLKRLWREQKEREANPEAFEEGGDADSGSAEAEEDFFRSRHEARPEDFERARGPAPSVNAREIYRRLVQRLHPDRGGMWTAAREQLWHEVQRAWAAGDADWLARLEVDWESANEVLGPNSPLSRLRRAIQELHAARRDTERKLRAYRSSPAWRFTLTEKKREELYRRTETNFIHDIQFLLNQLDHLDATIAGWEEDWTRSDSRFKSRRRRRSPSY